MLSVGAERKMAALVPVRDVMSKDVKVVRPDSSVREVVAAMNRYNVGSMVVVQGDRPVGVISERDILRRVVEPCLSPETLTAGQVMTSPVYTISETASIDEVAALMEEKKIRKIPVVDKEKIVGIITFTDIVTTALSILSTLEELI